MLSSVVVRSFRLHHISLIAEKQSSGENFSFCTGDYDFDEGSWFKIGDRLILWVFWPG